RSNRPWDTIFKSPAQVVLAGLFCACLQHRSNLAACQGSQQVRSVFLVAFVRCICTLHAARQRLND
ncbi:hypothetical protein O6461_25920, partial [Salmonella enterica subsp. enterica]